MPTDSGIIVLMGSGELTATMVTLHKELLDRYGNSGQAVFIDTPAGFQLNADHISQKAQDYFQSRIQHPLAIASLKAVASATAVELERFNRRISQADYILIGPGSPTYALAQWQQTRLPELMRRRIQAGGTLVAASAAALTVGKLTLPVYEIYKVGQEPHWVSGLDILEAFGFNLAVLPHWNNAEGGNHDTRYCFMGAPRLAFLESQLPEDTFLLGLDEHTALVIDLARQAAFIRGIGRITLRRRGEELVFDKESEIPLSLLRGRMEAGGAAAGATRASEESPLPQPLDQALWESLHGLAKAVQEGLEACRVEKATSALLALEHHIWKSLSELQEQNALGAAREVLREQISLMGAQLAERPASQKTCLQPLVEGLLALRRRFRDQKQWAQADAVRECLQQAGVVVEDTPAGSRWSVKE